MNGQMPSRKQTERAIKQLIDYVMAMNAIAIQKGLWTMEEFNRAAINMDKERRALLDLGHDSGMKIINIAQDLSKFTQKGE